MKTSQTTLVTAIKNLETKQKAIAKTLNDISLHYTDCIQDLIYRCGALEAIQIRLFSVLAETNPSAHLRIVEELNDSLQHIEGKGGHDSAYANHLRSLVGSQPGKKVHLKLVPKQDVSDSSKPNC